MVYYIIIISYIILHLHLYKIIYDTEIICDFVDIVGIVINFLKILSSIFKETFKNNKLFFKDIS